MNSSELVKKVQTDCSISTTKEVKRLLSSVFSSIISGLQVDKKVLIRGFGTFKLRKVQGRTYISPSTGKKVYKDAHEKIIFVPCERIKNDILA